jgi:hypothetical protein
MQSRYLDPIVLTINERTISAKELLKELQCARLMNRRQRGKEKPCDSGSMRIMPSVSFIEYSQSSGLTIPV